MPGPFKMSGPHKIPWHRNPDIRGYIAQGLLAGLIAWGLYVIYANTIANMEARGIPIGFGFLNEVAPFGVAFSPFIDFTLGESTYLTIFFIGIQNTIIVSIFGIIAATILGFIIGVMRLSPNWFVSKFASLYIEIFRNIPILLLIMFWNFAVFCPHSRCQNKALAAMVFSSIIAASIFQNLLLRIALHSPPFCWHLSLGSSSHGVCADMPDNNKS